MPLLKGKSSHGSKPMTSLSFTFSWMPHCCPQKQQCVLTSRSGSTEESARWPVGYAFNGPNLASNSGGRGGSAAIGSSLERGVPQVRVREGDQLSPAGRTDVLVVARRVLGPVVAVAQFPLDNDQIIDVDLRRERLPAAGAVRLLALLADVGVELDRELGRPLEDVEELAERQPQQGKDDRNGVRDGQELVGVALQPGVADRQEQPRDADREQQEQRQQVLLKILQGGGPVVPQTPAQRQQHSSDHRERRPDQAVEDQMADQRRMAEREGRQAKHEDLIARQVPRHRSEVDPAEHEGEG